MTRTSERAARSLSRVAVDRAVRRHCTRTRGGRPRLVCQNASTSRTPS